MFFGFLITDFALIPIFAILRIYIGAIVCFSLFVGTILISLIVVGIKQRVFMKFKPSKAKKDKYEILDGKVKACMLSSTTSVGGVRKYSTARLTKVIYLITVESAGNVYTAYSDKFYEKDETVRFYAIGKRSASIINENEAVTEPKGFLI